MTLPDECVLCGAVCSILSHTDLPTSKCICTSVDVFAADYRGL